MIRLRFQGYRCKSERSLFKLIEATLCMTTKYSYLMNLRPEDVSVDLDKDVLLLCQADGDPLPSITWEKVDHAELMLFVTNEFKNLSNHLEIITK